MTPPEMTPAEMALVLGALAILFFAISLAKIM